MHTRTRGQRCIIVECASEVADALDRLNGLGDGEPTQDEMWDTIVEVREALGRALPNLLHVAQEYPVYRR